ncbi:MAG: hypothetical protein EBR02_00455 [Alphaproteobacteria bacterium]|nr:hypothetical protein [Alphaproteobacteria bacterium]
MIALALLTVLMLVIMMGRALCHPQPPPRPEHQSAHPPARRAALQIVGLRFAMRRKFVILHLAIQDALTVEFKVIVWILNTLGVIHPQMNVKNVAEIKQIVIAETCFSGMVRRVMASAAMLSPIPALNVKITTAVREQAKTRHEEYARIKRAVLSVRTMETAKVQRNVISWRVR